MSGNHTDGDKLDKRTGASRHEAEETSTQGNVMLWTIFLVLLILWLLGFIGFHVLGNFIHILLVIALVVLILQLIRGRPSV